MLWVSLNQNPLSPYVRLWTQLWYNKYNSLQYFYCLLCYVVRAVLESHHFRRRRYYYNCCFWHFNSTSARVRSSAFQPHMCIMLSGGRPSHIIRIIFVRTSTMSPDFYVVWLTIRNVFHLLPAASFFVLFIRSFVHFSLYILPTISFFFSFCYRRFRPLMTLRTFNGAAPPKITVRHFWAGKFHLKYFSNKFKYISSLLPKIFSKQIFIWYTHTLDVSHVLLKIQTFL